MKKFIKQITLFSILSGFVIMSHPLYLMVTEKYKEEVAGHEIYLSILKSKKKCNAKKLILGDSVGRQIFDNRKFNDSINSLACNQAIAMIGHFILLDSYLKQGNKPEQVYLIFHPLSFANNLDQEFTYHYFIKPFYKDYQPYFSDDVKQQIEKVPYLWAHRFPTILTSNWAPNFVSNDTIEYSFLSPISLDYLQRIVDLSVEYNFRLTLLPVPVKEELKSEIEALDKNEISEVLKPIFSAYFSQIIYIDNSNFKDRTHLKNPEVYTEYYLLNLLD